MYLNKFIKFFLLIIINQNLTENNKISKEENNNSNNYNNILTNNNLNYLTENSIQDNNKFKDFQILSNINTSKNHSRNR